MRDINAVRKDLEDMKATHFVTKWFMDATPYIFEENTMDYILWREDVARRLNIDPSDILISGSASLGFSLNPSKNYKGFDERSDIDVCIVSSYYFETAWRELISLNINDVRGKMRSALADHRSRLIYWGTIATDKILPLLSFGPAWDTIIKECRPGNLFEGRDVNFRVYKDRRSVRDYLVEGIKKTQESLLEGE